MVWNITRETRVFFGKVGGFLVVFMVLQQTRKKALCIIPNTGAVFCSGFCHFEKNGCNLITIHKKLLYSWQLLCIMIDVETKVPERHGRYFVK